MLLNTKQLFGFYSFESRFWLFGNQIPTKFIFFSTNFVLTKPTNESDKVLFFPKRVKGHKSYAKDITNT